MRSAVKHQTLAAMILVFLTGCLFNNSSGSPELVVDNYAIYDASWSPDGNQLLLTYASPDLTEIGVVTLSPDGYIEATIAIESDKFSLFSEPQFWQTDQVIFNNSPPLIYSPGNVGELIVFDLENRAFQTVLTTIRIVRFEFNALTQSAILVLENRNGEQSLAAWDANGNEIESFLDLQPGQAITDLSINPPGTLAAFVLNSDAEKNSVSSRQHEIYIIEMETKRINRLLNPTTDGIGSLTWGPSDKCLAYIRTETGNYSATGRSIEFQNLQNDQTSFIESESLGMHIFSVTWSPTREMMAIVPVVSRGVNEVFLYDIPADVITKAGCN